MNSKKIFAVSDIHGHADELLQALELAGFDRDDPDHLLISCGDCFDRGRQNRAVLDYLRGLERKVLIRGNHEDMLERVLCRGRVDQNNVSNGTDRTVKEFYGQNAIDCDGYFDTDHAITDKLFAFMDGMMDYFETEHYVFTHGWVPLDNGYPTVSFDADWRIASYTRWGKARWLEWQRIYGNGLEIPDKTLVCGHRPAQYGGGFDRTRTYGDFSTFFGKGLIAIDGCTATSGRVNVLVLEDRLLETRQHRMELLDQPFERIADRSKTVEMRLYDEKRQQIQVGDTILFSHRENQRTLSARVLGVCVYPDFDALTDDFSPIQLGFGDRSREEIADFMKGLYGAEKCGRYRAAAIRIALLDGQ